MCDHHCTSQHFCVHCRMNTLLHTSYFCLLNWYCSSNFSASSSYIHSQSSLAFSLRGRKHTKAHQELFFLVSTKSLELSLRLIGIFFSSTYWSLSWFRFSMSRDLRRSLRIFFFFSLSVCLFPLRFSVCG